MYYINEAMDFLTDSLTYEDYEHDVPYDIIDTDEFEDDVSIDKTSRRVGKHFILKDPCGKGRIQYAEIGKRHYEVDKKRFANRGIE